MCWAEYFRLPDKQDMYLAQITAAIFQCFAGFARDKKEYRIKDFLLFNDDEDTQAGLKSGHIEGVSFVELLASCIQKG